MKCFKLGPVALMFLALATGSVFTGSASGQALEQAVAGLDKVEGYFTVYRNRTDGSHYLELNESSLRDGHDVIYHVQSVHGGNIGQMGLNSGRYLGTQILRFERHYNQIFVRRMDSRYVEASGTPLADRGVVDIQNPVLAILPILVSSEGGDRHIIDMQAIFATDTVRKLNYPDFPGRVDPLRSKSMEVRNFASNTSIRMLYTFELAADLGTASPDPSTANIILQHSFLALPHNDYEPRLYDPRVGYFRQMKRDLSAEDKSLSTGYINRWHLKAGDQSDPASTTKPIVYWIQNSTPLEYRDAVRAGALSWNEAFEKLGIKNAIEVRVQPDDATWDVGDIDYNVLTWMAPPTHFTNGYGPSLTDPRTGQILATDITLLDAALRSNIEMFRLTDGESETTMGQPQSAAPFIAQTDLKKTIGSVPTLTEGPGILGLLRASNTTSKEALDELIQQFIYSLVAHEVGHTLGLRHNFKGSFTTGYDIASQSISDDTLLTNSVMDYVLFDLVGFREGRKAYQDQLGLYDLWAIEYGYSLASDKLEDILSRADEPALAVGTDHGAMVDPYASRWDLTEDPVAYAAKSIKLYDELSLSVDQRYADGDLTRQEYQTASGLVASRVRMHASVITRFIGGYEVTAPAKDGPDLGRQAVPVDRKAQLQALNVLEGRFFAVETPEPSLDALRTLSVDIGDGLFVINNLQTNEWAASMVLANLLEANRLQRLHFSEDLGVDFGPQDLFVHLTKSLFKGDEKGSVNERRRALQQTYVETLIAMRVDADNYFPQTRVAAFDALVDVDRILKKSKGGDAATKAHRDYLAGRISTEAFGESARPKKRGGSWLGGLFKSMVQLATYMTSGE